jgi:hypothetical protein
METGYGLDGQISLLHIIQTASRAHRTSYAMGTGGCIPGNKASGGLKLIICLHIVPSSRMVELYLHSPHSA